MAPKRNAYSAFLFAKKAEFVRDGTYKNMEDLELRISGLWATMSTEEKNAYKAGPERGGFGGGGGSGKAAATRKFDNRGRDIAELQRAKKAEETAESARCAEIAAIVDRDDFLDMPLFVVHFNTFADTDRAGRDKFVPAEVAIVEFNLRDGTQKDLVELFKPEVELGKQFEMQQRSEKTHNLPLQSDTLYKKSHEEIAAAMRRWLWTATGGGIEQPIVLFSMPDEIRKVKYILQELELHEEVLVYNLACLFCLLYDRTLKVATDIAEKKAHEFTHPKGPWPFPWPRDPDEHETRRKKYNHALLVKCAERWLTDDPYEHAIPNVGCDFHTDVAWDESIGDRSDHCALGHCHKQIYTILDSMFLRALDIVPKPGSHRPLQFKDAEEAKKQRKVHSDISKVVRSEAIKREDTNSLGSVRGKLGRSAGVTLLPADRPDPAAITAEALRRDQEQFAKMVEAKDAVSSTPERVEAPPPPPPPPALRSRRYDDEDDTLSERMSSALNSSVGSVEYYTIGEETTAERQDNDSFCERREKEEFHWQ